MITVKIQNLNEIKTVFAKVPMKMTKELNVAVERVVLKIESSAKRNAPVNKKSGGGSLRQSIKSRMTGVASGEITVGASYGIYVHEGTRPHQIRIRVKKVLADKRAGRIFGKVVNHPGTKANPFLRKAVEDNQSFIDSEFKKAVERAIK
jgi:HK97 gp10 family phage protein